MADYHLPMYASQALAAAQDRVQELEAGTADAQSVLDLCSRYRCLGICAVLSQLDGVQAVEWWAASAQAFRDCVRQHPGCTPPTGLAQPLIDALACGDWELAKEVALLLPDTMRPGEEYEDEFLTMRFLIQRYIFHDQVGSEQTLAALAEIDLPPENQWLPALTAMVDGDAEGFAQAIEEFLVAHEERFAELTEREGLPEGTLHTEGRLSVSGVALVRLATIVGLHVAIEYPFVPALVITAPNRPMSPRHWRVLLQQG